MTIKWGQDARPSKADKPRKPRGSERPGHAHESALLTGSLVFIAAAGVIGFGSTLYETSSTDPAVFGNASALMFGAAGVMIVALAFWLMADVRMPILLVSGASSVALIVAALGSPVFLLLLPTTLCGLWAGLSCLRLHPRDRWTTVAVAIVLGILLGTIGILIFAPVALAAALVPELEFGDDPVRA